MKKVKRKYESTHRQLLAGKTREQILESARKLFSEKGYGETSIDEIAAEAGVSGPTVYATFKNKRAMLLQLLDEMEQRADASSLITGLQEHTGNERAQLRVVIEFSVRLFSEDRGMVAIGELAGKGDPDIGALWRTGAERRLGTCRMLLTGWEKRGLLREGLTEARAIDILWVLSGPEPFRLFTHDREWTPQEYCDWLYQLASEQLLRPLASPKGTPSAPGKSSRE